MSTNGFSFPPPPPPPPQRSHDAFPRPTHRRGYSVAASRGHGASRGNYSHRGGSFGEKNRGGSHRGAWNSTRPLPSTHPESGLQSKRNHAAAFPNNSRSRPQAPPAVPSFSAGIENLLLPNPPVKHVPTQQVRKTNLLGLTPATADASDSEDDKDEESRLGSNPLVQDLQFEYEGQTATLRTAREIAAWIAERRKRWPTEARREVARKEAEQKKQQWEDQKEKKKQHWEEQKRKKIEVNQAAKQKQAEHFANHPSSYFHEKAASRSHPDKDNANPTQAAQLRTERLRRKAARAQMALEAAERDLLYLDKTTCSDSIAKEKDAVSEYSLHSLSNSSQLTDSDSTTSSDSDTEDDPGPEQLSSKLEVEKPLRQQNTTSTKNICQYFVKHGTCRYGSGCKYSHDPDGRASRPRQLPPTTKSGRKGLWQVLVEKEEEEERKKVLHAIIALGKQGVFDGPT